MKFQLSEANLVESIVLFLDEQKHPVAFKNRLLSLTESGLSDEEARNVILEGIEVEVYCDKQTGVFLLESEIVECGAELYHPYTGKELELPQD